MKHDRRTVMWKVDNGKRRNNVSVKSLCLSVSPSASLPCSYLQRPLFISHWDNAFAALIKALIFLIHRTGSTGKPWQLGNLSSSLAFLSNSEQLWASHTWVSNHRGSWFHKHAKVMPQSLLCSKHAEMHTPWATIKDLSYTEDMYVLSSSGAYLLACHAYTAPLSA